MSVSIEITRTHLPSGAPAPLTEVHEVHPRNSWQTVPDAVEEWIRPFHPSRTSRSCVYLFDSPELGRGRLVVHDLGIIYRSRMDEKVQMLEVERALGQRQPAKLSDTLPWMYAVRVQVRNPYMQIVFGLIATAVGCLPLHNIFFASDMGAMSNVYFFILGITLVLFGFVGLVCRGLYRMRWWHRARAEVKRRGDKMPEDLQLFP